MILEENMWLKTQKLLPKEQKLPPITWNINKEVWLWWFLGAIPTQCWNSRLLLQKRHIRRISISKKQMGSSKNKRKSNSLIEKFASCNQWTWWLLRLSLIVCIWNDEFVSAWQSAEFWRNALGRPPCWTKTASLSTGALICTPTLCGIFWIIYLLLSITSNSFFGTVFKRLPAHTPWLPPLLRLPWDFNFRSISMYQTHLHTHFSHLGHAFERLKHLFWFGLSKVQAINSAGYVFHDKLIIMPSSHLRALPGEIKWKKWLNYLYWLLIKRYYACLVEKQCLCCISLRVKVHHFPRG